MRGFSFSPSFLIVNSANLGEIFLIPPPGDLHRRRYLENLPLNKYLGIHVGTSRMRLETQSIENRFGKTDLSTDVPSRMKEYLSHLA